MGSATLTLEGRRADVDVALANMDVT